MVAVGCYALRGHSVCVFGVKCGDFCGSEGAVALGAVWHSDAGRKWGAKMGWIPNKDEILSEVQNYGDLSFFKKSKNTLVIFVVVMSALTILLMRGQEGYFTSGGFYETAFSIFLAIFIFLNHRWAMLAFAAIYIFGRITIITYAVMLNSRLPFSAIIFGAVAAVLTYSAYKVATELKRAKVKSVADS